MIRLYVFLSLLLCTLRMEADEATSQYKYKIALAAIFQNDAAFMREWIEFHALLGVEHFWLYNNSSEDDYLTVLEPYIASGLVELINWPSTSEEDWNRFTYTTQPLAYSDALIRAKSKAQLTKWLLIIDTDEFLFPVEHYYLWDCLEECFSDCPGICVNWQLYGTSQVAKVDPGQLMIEQLVYKAPIDYVRHNHFKCIVQPACTIGCNNPHFCLYKEGLCHVSTDHEELGMYATHVLLDKLRINHYWTRDEDYVQRVKVPRYHKWTQNGEVVYYIIPDLNRIYDDAIAKYVPALRRRLGLSCPP